MPQGETRIFKEKALLNSKVCLIKYFYEDKHEFMALIMLTPFQNTDQFNFDDLSFFTEKIKNDCQTTVDKVKMICTILLIEPPLYF